MPLVKPELPPRPSSTAAEQKGRSPVFAPCPRSAFATGDSDWYNIATPRSFQGVDICPSCYDATFRDTPYAGCLTKAPPMHKDTVKRCDLSDRWNRAATFWLFLQGAPDLNLLGTVAALPPDEDGHCPNVNMQYPEPQQEDRPTATRTWYCLLDPTTGSLIEDLTVCSACVARANAIFPSMRGIFRSVADGHKVQATCDLLTVNKDGNRGGKYFDKMVEVAQQSLQTGTLDTRPLTDYIKKWAPVPVCMQADPALPGTKSWTFPTSIPHYAICEECYTYHIVPLLESSHPPTILKELRPAVWPSGFVCDLYSPRLIQWFKDACASGDLATYKQRIMAREAQAQEYKLKLDQLRIQHRQHEQQARLFSMQQHMARSQETVRAMQWNSSAYYAPPLDFSRSTEAMNQSHQAMLQAEMVEENMNMLRKEWVELYE
ncbi:uncharacterized protein M421DRAFT_218193 [Didymella exigua CBS 183.55]|uniref:Uncharacterized protein n=1 Tax=Didymella exigua CBS 183.55 TaxID=1150837 RepID=A0A6A5RG85_9PLEO|nr:uncharacterized protein M421DRAFT_218193 [Didymella exigua CBS 183.55]KAF1926168.1 hypothetical protein M421DRAFT_218193 [Didymella exigua CBS 183.55]